jgi:hypothetical protein
MKNVCFIFLGIILTSGWWGFGLYKYHGIEELPFWFCILFAPIVLGSIVTLAFVVLEVVLAIIVNWDN